MNKNGVQVNWLYLWTKNTERQSYRKSRQQFKQIYYLYPLLRCDSNSCQERAKRHDWLLLNRNCRKPRVTAKSLRSSNLSSKRRIIGSCCSVRSIFMKEEIFKTWIPRAWNERFVTLMFSITMSLVRFNLEKLGSFDYIPPELRC